MVALCSKLLVFVELLSRDSVVVKEVVRVRAPIVRDPEAVPVVETSAALFVEVTVLVIG
jgi:hypothetical protein